MVARLLSATSREKIINEDNVKQLKVEDHQICNGKGHLKKSTILTTAYLTGKVVLLLLANVALDLSC